MKTETVAFMVQARYDLDVAGLLLEHQRPAAAAFHAQQAAEMALKAVHVERRRRLARSHDLSALAAAAGAPTPIQRHAARLAPVYLETRYFDARTNGHAPSEEYTPADAADDLAAATEVVQWAASHLHKDEH